MDKQDNNFNFGFRRHRLLQNSIGGAIIIAIGIIFLLQNFLNFDVMGKLWPVILIIIGVGVVFSQRKRLL